MGKEKEEILVTKILEHNILKPRNKFSTVFWFRSRDGPLYKVSFLLVQGHQFYCKTSVFYKASIQKVDNRVAHFQ